MEHELAHTVERVLAQITPTQDECEGVSALANALTELCEESAREAGARVVCTLVGSVARGTWLKGAHDFDVFMLFPPELAREELERQGLELANSAAQKVSLLVGERVWKLRRGMPSTHIYSSGTQITRWTSCPHTTSTTQHT